MKAITLSAFIAMPMYRLKELERHGVNCETCRAAMNASVMQWVREVCDDGHAIIFGIPLTPKREP